MAISTVLMSALVKMFVASPGSIKDEAIVSNDAGVGAGVLECFCLDPWLVVGAGEGRNNGRSVGGFATFLLFLLCAPWGTGVGDLLKNSL
jgi:hypothetical protein